VGDVGVVQARDGPRFALEERAVAAPIDQFLPEHLDGDVPVETWIVCQQDLGHAACTKMTDDAIAAEAGTEPSVSDTHGPGSHPPARRALPQGDGSSRR
jgi:hypothetical protein